MRSSQWLLPLMLMLTHTCSGTQVPAEESHSTSVAGMVKLLEVEAQLIDNLLDYADEMESKLKTVRRSIASMLQENFKARSSTEQYLSNPLNSFSLIRRMNRDWMVWQLYMEKRVGLKQVDRIQELREHMPTSTDVQEAVTAVDRIQSTYGLKVADITNGNLNGKQYNVSLTALDTYALGQVLFDQGNYIAAAGWLYQTLISMKNYTLAAPMELSKSEVRSIYAETLLRLKQNADALTVINIALADKPNDIKLLVKKSEIETLIRTGANAAPQKPTTEKPGVPNTYQLGCRGQFKPSADARLHCRYNTTTSPFLILAPLKMELVGLEPYMVLYHDVLSAKEIEELQDMATPGLKRATVVNSSGRNEVVKTRTSKVAWFPDSFSPLTLRLNARVADMTGFQLVGSELLQVMNYGLGGHYASHYDYFNNANKTELNGDRIATVLFYLTDVEQGGATVFPTIQKAVFPQRGSAIVWYNLKEDGEPNILTLHAACPVIVGSKWVCNKWIREREQLFRRPCLKEKSK